MRKKKHTHRVFLHSRPGTYPPIDVQVDVTAVNDVDAEDRAIDELKRTKYPDRPRHGWLIDHVEPL